MSKKSGVKVDVKRDSTKGRLWSRLKTIPLLQSGDQIYKDIIKKTNDKNEALIQENDSLKSANDSLKLIIQSGVKMDIKITPKK